MPSNIVKACENARRKHNFVFTPFFHSHVVRKMKELRAHLLPHTNYNSVEEHQCLKTLLLSKVFTIPYIPFINCERMQPITGIEEKKLRSAPFVTLHYIYKFLLCCERLRKVDEDKKMNNGIIKTTITARIA